jgi:maleate isomerase
VLTPDFDPVPESELWAMAPPGISIHGSRVSYKRGDPKSFADPPNIDEAVRRFIELSPRVILYAYTSSSYVLRHKSEEQLRLRLESI